MPAECRSHVKNLLGWIREYLRVSFCVYHVRCMTTCELRGGEYEVQDGLPADIRSRDRSAVRLGFDRSGRVLAGRVDPVLEGHADGDIQKMTERWPCKV